METFKKEAARSPVFALALPFVCLQNGITPSDVKLVCDGMKAGVIPAHSMTCWASGGVLAKLEIGAFTRLFDQLFDMDGDAYSIGLDIMGMYVLPKRTASKRSASSCVWR